MSPLFVRGVAVALGVILGGCAPTTAVVFDFPTSSAFRASELIRLDVVRLTDGDLGGCPDILDRSVRGDALDLALELEPTSVCDIRAGLTLADPGSGAFAFVAQVLDNRSAPILVGCTIGEVYPGSPPVRIELYPTGGYNESVARSDAAMRVGASCGGAP